MNNDLKELEAWVARKLEKVTHYLKKLILGTGLMIFSSRGVAIFKNSRTMNPILASILAMAPTYLNSEICWSDE